MTNDVMMIIGGIAAPFVIFAIVLAYVDIWSNQVRKQE